MTDSTPIPASSGIQKRFLRQVLRLAGPYWSCERRAKIRGATLLLLLLTMAQVGLTVWSNYWQRALFDALEQHSLRGVLLQVAVFALIFIISIAVTATHLIVKRWLMIDWRAWLTDQLVGTWMADGRHYRLLFSFGDHDNPDQRIAEDIRIATESAIALAHSLVYSLMVMSLPGTRDKCPPVCGVDISIRLVTGEGNTEAIALYRRAPMARRADRFGEKMVACFPY